MTMPEPDNRLAKIPTSPVPQDFPQNSYNVSGLVVMTRPEKIDPVTQSLNAIAGVEVHASNAQGKLVVTVEELAGQKTMVGTIHDIQNIPGVLNASLVYSRMDNEDIPDNNVELTP